MRKPELDNIEIVEPPIGELSKQRGSFKKTCLTGCGCLVFFVVLALGGLKLYIGSGPQKLKAPPDNFPSDIPIYEKDAIDSITYISGKYKKRSFETAAFFPKVILSPLLLQLRNESPSSTDFFSQNRSFWKLITTPVTDDKNTVEIRWSNMDAEPRFVVSFYRKELDKKGYSVSEIVKEDKSYRINFENQLGISGTLSTVGDEENKPGTDFAYLTVNIPDNYIPSSTPATTSR